MRTSVLIGAAVLMLLSGAGLLLMNVTTPQALAFGILGLSLGAFGIGTGHEVEFPTTWRGLRGRASHDRPATESGMHLLWARRVLETSPSVRTRSIKESALRRARPQAA